MADRASSLRGGLAGRLAGRLDAGVQGGVLGMHLGQRGGSRGGRDMAGEDLDGHRAGDAAQVQDAGPAQVAAGAVGRGLDNGIAGVIGRVVRPGRLPVAIAGRPVGKGPGQFPALPRAV
jgi:hypothetical protein